VVKWKDERKAQDYIYSQICAASATLESDRRPNGHFKITLFALTICPMHGLMPDAVRYSSSVLHKRKCIAALVPCATRGGE